MKEKFILFYKLYCTEIKIVSNKKYKKLPIFNQNHLIAVDSK